MRYEIFVNVFGNEYMTESNPEGECYRSQEINGSYAEAKALAYEYLVEMLQRFYKVSPEYINPSPAKGICPFQETFDHYVPFDGYEGYIQRLKGGNIYTFIVPLN